MSQHPENGPSFRVASAPTTVASLTAALQFAIEFAVFPERLKVDYISTAGRLEALSKKLLREAKNIPTHGVSEADEADGMSDAIGIIESIINQLRTEV
jgi:hypothetical protein